MFTEIKRTIQKPVRLSKSDLKGLKKDAAIKRKRVRAKTILFEQGADADGLYYIIQGKVQITVLSAQGRERMIGITSSGGFVGEICLTSQALYLDTATAFADCEVLYIPAMRMHIALANDPALATYFTDFLLRHSMDVQAELVDHLFNSSEKRLARILLLLANYNGGGQLDVIPHMTHELLAERVGTIRARISFFLNKICRLGLIDYNGEISVHSGLLNVILPDAPTRKRP